MFGRLLLAALLFMVLSAPLEASAADHVAGEFDFRMPAGTTSAQVKGWIKKISSQYGLDPCLVQALIEIESGGDPKAVSPKGAQGLMQIMPGTAGDLKLSEPFDPSANIDAGSRYLRQQLKAFDGDVRLALAAYNAGPEAVRKAHGIPPIPETERYVALVANRFIQLKTGGDMKAFVKKVLEGKTAGVK